MEVKSATVDAGVAMKTNLVYICRPRLWRYSAVLISSVAARLAEMKKKRTGECV